MMAPRQEATVVIHVWRNLTSSEALVGTLHRPIPKHETVLDREETKLKQLNRSHLVQLVASVGKVQLTGFSLARKDRSS